MTDQTTPAPAAPSVPPAAPSASPPAPGGSPAPWFADDKLGFDQDTRDYLGGKNYTGIADAIKAGRQFETLARDRNAITAPVAGKETDWEHWDKLGWVADKTKYLIEPPKLPNGVDWNPNVQTALTDVLHGAKVPLPAAKAVIEALGKVTADNTQAMLAADQKLLQDEMAALKADWGKEFDAKVDKAKQVFQAFGLPVGLADEAADLLGYGKTLRMFAAIGDKLSEDALVTSASSGAVGASSARAQRLQLEADPAFMQSINDSRHPQHQTNMARRNALLSQEAGR